MYEEKVPGWTFDFIPLAPIEHIEYLSREVLLVDIIDICELQEGRTHLRVTRRRGASVIYKKEGCVHYELHEGRVRTSYSYRKEGSAHP
jgi:hypothetical protein